MVFVVKLLALPLATMLLIAAMVVLLFCGLLPTARATTPLAGRLLQTAQLTDRPTLAPMFAIRLSASRDIGATWAQPPAILLTAPISLETLSTDASIPASSSLAATSLSLAFAVMRRPWRI